MAIGFTGGTSKQLRLRMEKTDPNKKEDNWEFTVTAILFYSTGDPAPDYDIQFYLNGKPHEDPEVTGGDGRITKDFSLGKGNHLIEAQVMDSPAVRSKLKVNLKDEGGGKKKIPKDIRIEKFGSLGKYALTLAVLDEGGGVIPEATVEIGSEYGTEEGSPFSTNKKTGLLVCRISFREKKRTYRIGSGGVSKHIILAGPLDWGEKKEVASV